MRIKTKDLALAAMFTALTAICSWICIPGTVPFTMQTFAVFLAVGLLGGRLGTLSVAAYILLGAFGLPVFSGFSGGFGVLFGATGGYIIGFLFSALTMWAVERLFGRGIAALGAAMVLGLAVCYGFGTAWFVLVYSRSTGLAAAFAAYVAPFIAPDLLKLSLALAITVRLRKTAKFIPAVSNNPKG